MPDPGNGETRFQVHISGVIAKELQRLQKLAAREGKGDAFLSAFRQIVERLSFAPNDFGEPLHRLPALRMQIRVGAILPVFVDFGVCEDRPLVFIKGARMH
jgi:hypothetical protein